MASSSGRPAARPASAASSPMAGPTGWPNLASRAHALTTQELMAQLGSSPSGLTHSTAAAALQKYGPNAWSVQQKSTALQILWRQLSNLLILMLLAAAAVSFAIGHALDAMGILAAVLLSVLFGFFQEYKAEQALTALQKMTAPRAIVLREGREYEIPSHEVVPGDLLILSEGMLVPADARLLQDGSIAVDQSALTGESHPVHKHHAPLPLSTPLAERTNMAYAGTQIVRGHGHALAIATGLSTEFGRIAASLASTPSEPTPLQKHLTALGERVGQVAIGLAFLFFLLGLWRGVDWPQMLVVAVSLAVAAIPEGLPTVLAITMAIGVQRMAAHKALVRKLPAVETLGSATVICTDKTGTLTANRMTLTRLCVDGADYAFEGGPTDLASAIGRFGKSNPRLSTAERAAVQQALAAFSLCNDAALLYNADGSLQGVRGDPTETALLMAAKKAGLEPDELRTTQPKLHELPFEYSRKMMSQIRSMGGANAKSSSVAYVKGAPEEILARCTHYWHQGRSIPMTAAHRRQLQQVTEQYAQGALRTLAVAMRTMPAHASSSASKYTPQLVERELTWVGVCGLIDPPRPEAREALRLCQRAGIRVIMLTGDSLVTARVIAQQLGLLREGGLVLEAGELDTMSDERLRSMVGGLCVLARATPEHKFRIIEALQKNGEVVAVTGDGVNDAPSIQKADIGVAMGIGGTDVARGAADLVLTDNNFGTLVRAVERGRSIFENIRSFVRFQFTTNVAALCLMFSAPILGLPLPLAPLQILWINIIMDGPPAIALGLEPKRADSMSRPPRKPNAPFLSRAFILSILRTGLLIFLVTLGTFVWYLRTEPAKATTMAFTVFIALQLVNALNCRAWRRPAWENLGHNKALVAALLLSLALHLAIVYFAPLQAIFGTVALGASDWVVLLAAGLLLLTQEEAFKLTRKGED